MGYWDTDTYLYILYFAVNFVVSDWTSVETWPQVVLKETLLYLVLNVFSVRAKIWGILDNDILFDLCGDCFYKGTASWAQVSKQLRKPIIWKQPSVKPKAVDGTLF